MIQATAHAKINLCLEVLGRRDDGYHNIATVLQAISLADKISVEDHNSIVLGCDDASLNGADNLVVKAAEALRATTGARRGARITLTKKIPVAAGLGGGSADAAAALLVLDRLWGTRLPREELVRLGAGLGSDVPFFLSDVGMALAQERGEQLTPLGLLPLAWAVLVFPPVTSLAPKTARLYGLLQPRDYSDGSKAGAWVEGLHRVPLWATLLLYPGLHNVFEKVAPAAYPGILDAWNTFREVAGPTAPHLAGSGPTLFALYPESAPARSVYNALEARGLRVALVETVGQPVELEG